MAMGYYVHTLQNGNHSLRIHLQLAKIENQQLLELLHKKTQLVNYFNTRLQSIKSTNQRILKGLQKENDQNIAELQSSKGNNQKLLAEKKELQKENDQNIAELQSSKENNQRLLAEKKELQKENDQNIAELQSLKERLLAEKKEVQKKNDLIHEIYADLLSSKDKNQQLLEEKIELIENKTQVLHIHTWVESIERLEDYLYTIIHKMPESHNRDIIIRNIDLMMEYTKQCRKFLDAVLFDKVEELKTLKANSADMDKEMDEIRKEASHFTYQNERDEDTIIHKDTIIYEHIVYEPAPSPEIGLQELSTTVSVLRTAVSTAYTVGSAVGSAVYNGLCWGFSLFFS